MSEPRRYSAVSDLFDGVILFEADDVPEAFAEAAEELLDSRELSSLKTWIFDRERNKTLAVLSLVDGQPMVKVCADGLELLCTVSGCPMIEVEVERDGEVPLHCGSCLAPLQLTAGGSP